MEEDTWENTYIPMIISFFSFIGVLAIIFYIGIHIHGFHVTALFAPLVPLVFSTAWMKWSKRNLPKRDVSVPVMLKEALADCMHRWPWAGRYSFLTMFIVLTAFALVPVGGFLALDLITPVANSFLNNIHDFFSKLRGAM